MTPLSVLRSSSFGQRTAEEEREKLHEYFVETEQWRQVFDGDIDVIYGPKGSGKSAIYSLIVQNQDALFDRDILIVTAENPQGAPAFQSLSDDPPKDEFEFVSLWKLYALTLCGQAIKDYGLTGEKCKKVVAELENADLLPSNFSLAKALRYAFDYVRRFSRPDALETELKFDVNTGLPTGLKGRISLREPGAAQAKKGIVSIDDLFSTANEALREAGQSVWILLDRLDVAFADKPGLETLALRALFKFYLDTKSLRQIKTKIFLRTDIWSAITKEGFREASHIERSLEIRWKVEDLTNLVAKRALSNREICQFYNLKKEDVLGNYKSQEAFIFRMFPQQVETGPNKPNTFSWILGRTRDAVQKSAPRELIHFLNVLRDVQINRLERGERPPTEGRLFEQIAFKDTLPTVSKVRLSIGVQKGPRIGVQKGPIGRHA
ncbi:hypothetical protein PUR21_21585 [Methylorubrum rhodesianum]|uniref:Uncharacterized protein n=1 Tax=Methylorubrum rhodesianum TaxID=29427 RepID=A0ABU9ZFZ7_9HYPH